MDVLVGDCGCCGGGTVPTGCCGNEISTTLTATISGTSNCDGSYNMTWNGSSWVMDSVAIGSCGGPTAFLNLSCAVGNWVLYTNNGANGPYGPDPMSSSCSPFSQVFTGLGSALGACCTGSDPTVTITE